MPISGLDLSKCFSANPSPLVSLFSAFELCCLWWDLFKSNFLHLVIFFLDSFSFVCEERLFCVGFLLFYKKVTFRMDYFCRNKVCLPYGCFDAESFPMLVHLQFFSLECTFSC